MRMHQIGLLGLIALGMAASPRRDDDILSDDTPKPRKHRAHKREIVKPSYTSHHETPEGGWPETRQQRRARERRERTVS